MEIQPYDTHVEDALWDSRTPICSQARMQVRTYMLFQAFLNLFSIQNLNIFFIVSYTLFSYAVNVDNLSDLSSQDVFHFSWKVTSSCINQIEH